MWNPLQDTHGKALQVYLTIACSSGFLLFGYDQGVFSGVIVSPYFLETFNNPSASLLGIISAIFDVGGAVGALLCILIGAQLGRKKIIMMGCVISVAGALLQGLAKTTAQLLVGRIVGGIGIGQLTSTIGIWQAETSQAHNRGMLMSIELSMCALGLFLSQWINYGFGSDTTGTAFIFPLLFQIVFLGGTMMLVPLLPESPRWLVSRGRIDDARLSLLRIAPKGTSIDDEAISKSLTEMEQIALLEDVSGLEWIKSLFIPGPTQNGKRVLMSCLTNSFQQLSGVNSITYYVPTLLITFIGVSRSDSLWIGGLTSVISLVFSFVPVIFIDRVGRLPFLIGGAIVHAMCFYVVAGLFANLPPTGSSNSKAFGIGIVSMIYLFFASFSATWLGPSWMYAAEILPLKGRSHGMGLSTIFYWMFNFLIVMITPSALQNISWKYYIILGIFNTMFVPCLWFFVETKGKTLEDLDLYFAERFHGGKELHEFQEKMATEATLKESVIQLENVDNKHPTLPNDKPKEV